MRNPQNIDKFIRPELFLVELLRSSAQGKLLDSDSNVQVFFRATVLAVDLEGGRLENPDASGTYTAVVDGRELELPALVGPQNPPNSIKARILTDGRDTFSPDHALRTFWPIFPEHIAATIKPGEHAYVLFEDIEWSHGLWFGKVPGHQGLSFFEGSRGYTNDFGGSSMDAFESPNTAPASLVTDSENGSRRRPSSDTFSVFPDSNGG